MTGAGTLTTTLTCGEFEGLAPSARVIYLLLRAEGPMTRKELAEPAGVVPDTVSTALAELKRRDLAGQQRAPSGSSAHWQFFAKAP